MSPFAVFEGAAAGLVAGALSGWFTARFLLRARGLGDIRARHRGAQIYLTRSLDWRWVPPVAALGAIQGGALAALGYTPVHAALSTFWVSALTLLYLFAAGLYTAVVTRRGRGRG